MRGETDIFPTLRDSQRLKTRPLGVVRTSKPFCPSIFPGGHCGLLINHDLITLTNFFISWGSGSTLFCLLPKKDCLSAALNLLSRMTKMTGFIQLFIVSPVKAIRVIKWTVYDSMNFFLVCIVTMIVKMKHVMEQKKKLLISNEHFLDTFLTCLQYCVVWRSVDALFLAVWLERCSLAERACRSFFSVVLTVLTM